MVGIEDGWNEDASGGTGQLDKLRPWVAAWAPVRAALLREFASDETLCWETEYRDWDELHPDEEYGPEKKKECLKKGYLEKRRLVEDDLWNNARGGIRSDRDTTQVRRILQDAVQSILPCFFVSAVSPSEHSEA